MKWLTDWYIVRIKKTTQQQQQQQESTTKNKQFLILLPTSRKFDRFQNFPTCCAVVQLPMLSSHWGKMSMHMV